MFHLILIFLKTVSFLYRQLAGTLQYIQEVFLIFGAFLCDAAIYLHNKSNSIERYCNTQLKTKYKKFINNLIKPEP